MNLTERYQAKHQPVEPLQALLQACRQLSVVTTQIIQQLADSLTAVLGVLVPEEKVEREPYRYPFGPQHNDSPSTCISFPDFLPDKREQIYQYTRSWR